MFTLCCGGREENEGDSTGTPKFQQRKRKEAEQWLSEASNSPWQESEYEEPRSSQASGDWTDHTTKMVIEIVRAKRLRSGYASVHFMRPFVRVYLSDGKDDGRLLCKTSVAKFQSDQDTVVWNFQAASEYPKDEMETEHAVLRFEIVDADDCDTLVIREFKGQDLIDLINSDKITKKIVKLSSGGGTPARGGKRPSIHVALTITPPQEVGRRNKSDSKATHSLTAFDTPGTRRESRSSLLTKEVINYTNDSHQGEPSLDLKNWKIQSPRQSPRHSPRHSPRRSPKRSPHTTPPHTTDRIDGSQQLSPVSGAGIALENAFNAITADAASAESEDGGETEAEARKVINALGQGMKRFVYINSSTQRKTTNAAVEEEAVEVKAVAATQDEKGETANNILDLHLRKQTKSRQHNCPENMQLKNTQVDGETRDEEKLTMNTAQLVVVDDTGENMSSKKKANSYFLL